jgi:hypothetical protein
MARYSSPSWPKAKQEKPSRRAAEIENARPL